MQVRLGLIATLLLGSGLSALVYQTVWQASFRLVFGATGSASAAVLGIFLGCLGLGGWLLGSRIDQNTRPLRVYGNLEIAIALLAVISPQMIELANRAYAMSGGSLVRGQLLATLVRIGIVLLIIGPPAFLMGGTLPAAARAAVRESDQNRTGLAHIYALNTLGSVLGALIGPLYFFQTHGIRATLYGAVLLNLLVGLTARALSRFYETQASLAPHLSPSPNSSSEEHSTDEAASLPQVAPRLVYLMTALTGFCFLYLELIWFRMLAPLLGGSSVTFALIIATALAGIGLGSLLYSWWSIANSQRSNRTNSLHPLIFTLLLQAVFVAAPFAWGEDLALTTAHLRNISNLGPFGLLGGWLFVTFVVVFPAALISGFQFPYLLALLGKGRTHVAQQLGRAYAFNTLGTIFGSLFGGFLLIPWLGATTSWRLVAIALALTSIIVAIAHFQQFLKQGQTLVFAALTVLVIVLLSARGPGKIWRHTPIGAGRVQIAGLSINALRDRIHTTYNSILFEQDGIEASLAIDISDGLAFLVNGKSDGSVVGDRGTQIMLGLIPAALHTNPKSAFVVGLGTGTTGGMLALLHGIETVHIAEIEPATKKVAELAASANGDLLNNSKASIYYGDARELLLGGVHKYDLVVSEPSNPYRMGVASLFTQQFYQIVDSRLASNGLFAQWLQGYEIDAITLSTVITTLHSTFQNVSIWNSGQGDFVLIASHQPQTMNADVLESKLAKEPFKTWFTRSRFVGGVEAFAAQQLFPAQSIHLLTDRIAGTLNTDDLNFLEFAFARSTGIQSDLGQQLCDMVIEFRLEPEIKGRVDRDKIHCARTHLMPHLTWPRQLGGIHFSPNCEKEIGSSYTKDPIDLSTKTTNQIWEEASDLATSGHNESLARVAALAARGFHAEAHLIETELALARGETQQAIEVLEKTFRHLRLQALPLRDTPQKALRLTIRLAQADPARGAQRLFDALAEGEFSMFIEENARRNTLVILATLSGSNGGIDAERCTKAFNVWEPYPKWNQSDLALRQYCYQRSAHPLEERATEDLAKFMRFEPSRYSFGEIHSDR